MLQKSLCAAGIRFQNPCQFWSDLGRGSGRDSWRNGDPMMQGRRHWHPPHDKARAMACSGNPRAFSEGGAGENKDFGIFGGNISERYIPK